MTTEQVLIGMGLTLVLAVGSQILASRLRIPTDLTRPVLSRRYEDGAAVQAQPAADALPPGCDVLFLVRRVGRLDPVTEGSRPLPLPGDTVVLLTSGGRA
ncbi:hypothetical protein [Streptomyces sp. NPDC055140]